MGVVKKAASIVTGGLIGGEKPKAAPAPQPAPAAATQDQSAAAGATTMEAQEEERRKRILALNQQGAGGQLTGPGGVTGQATVARKALLGL